MLLVLHSFVLNLSTLIFKTNKESLKKGEHSKEWCMHAKIKHLKEFHIL